MAFADSELPVTKKKKKKLLAPKADGELPCLSPFPEDSEFLYIYPSLVLFDSGPFSLLVGRSYAIFPKEAALVSRVRPFPVSEGQRNSKPSGL